LKKINENLDSQISLKEESQISIESKAEQNLIEQEEREILNVNYLIKYNN